MVEKSDKFDERMLNRLNFSYQILHLENFDVTYFTVNLSSYVRHVRVCHVMSQNRMLKYFRPITIRRTL